MATFNFTFVLKLHQDDKFDVIADQLYEAGCDDALFGACNYVTTLEFDREANTLEEAVYSAMTDVKKVGKVEISSIEIGRRVVKATYEPATNMGYIYLVEEKEANSDETIPVYDKDGENVLFVLDVDKDGRLIGIELFQADKQMPLKLMKTAKIYETNFKQEDTDDID